MSLNFKIISFLSHELKPVAPKYNSQFFKPCTGTIEQAQEVQYQFGWEK